MAAISVRGLGKQYRLGLNAHNTLRDHIAAIFRRSRNEAAFFWALRDVTFDVAEGEVIGIVGRNGAGKSTLLKILSQITDPTEGEIRIRGRVSSLLEVGTGFHPELSGRENIFLNGAILGMTRREIRAKFDDIVAFAEVEKFIDTPVKHYSSGMYVRLAFAVAAHLDPEILIIDEVLAVGDAVFQRKCLGKMEEVGKRGRTVLFVSHNMAAVQHLCTRGLLLRNGKVDGFGSIEEIIRKYVQGTRDGNPTGDLREVPDRQGTGVVRFTKIAVTESSGESVEIAHTGQDIEIQLDYAAKQSPLANAGVYIGVHDMFDQMALGLGSEMTSGLFAVEKSEGRVIARIPRLPLMPGRYRISVNFQVNGEASDIVYDAMRIDVEPGDFYETGKLYPNPKLRVLVPHAWKIH
jgi:lipopolysaccharide transport system ATP-binding protein